MSTTVTKIAPRRFLVEGVIAVIAGRIENEAYARVFTTLRAAELDAAELNRINSGALAGLAEVRADRLARAEAYTLERATRADVGQAAFAF
jgi:hypothetical protein